MTTTDQPRINRVALIILAALAIVGLLTAWEALANYGELIALVYAGAAILSAVAWATLFVTRIVYGLRERHADHKMHQTKIHAQAITTIAEAKLTRTRMTAKRRKLLAEATKAEKEAQLITIIAKRDEQVLIADADSNRKFTAAHLQLSGQINGVQIAPTPEQIAAWSQWHGPRSQAAATPLLQEAAAPTAPPEPIIPALVNRQRILIVGASDAGKTTLLRWLIEAKQNCLVIDPHGSPAKWGPNTMQIGKGLDYPAISQALPQLIAEMKKRHGEIGDGKVIEGQHSRITVIIDEHRGIVKYCEGAGGLISDLLTDGRKVNIDLIVASHSRLVKALGIEGEGDLRKGYVIVNLYGGNGEPHRATLEFNADGNEIEYALPGPYPSDDGPVIQDEADLESILDAPLPEPEPVSTIAYDTKRARKIRAMYNEGVKKAEIARTFGHKSNSGAIFYEIKAALETNAAETTTTTETA